MFLRSEDERYNLLAVVWLRWRRLRGRRIRA